MVLPREVEDFLTSRLYTLGEFPLLDTVFKEDRLVHITLENTPSQPTEWEEMIPEDNLYTAEAERTPRRTPLPI